MAYSYSLCFCNHSELVSDSYSAFHTATELNGRQTTSVAGGRAGASERERIGTYQWGTTILEPNTASGVTVCSNCQKLWHRYRVLVCKLW